MAYTDDAALLVKVLWAWVVHDPSWHAAVDWQFIDVEAADLAAAGAVSPRAS